MLLTAQLLLQYQRCNRRAFLDVHGDRNFVEPPSDFHLKLLQDRLTLQQTVLSEQTYHQPEYPKGNWEAAAQATLALMQQGVEQIHKGVLLTNMENGSNCPSPITLLSSPDLLVKQPGKSCFGDWHYVPLDIELGKRAKLDYQIVAAFHAHVLARVQGAMPDTAWLILRERGRYSVKLDIRLPQMLLILAECCQALLSQQSPEVFISRQKCNICRWHSYCYGIAKSQQHLSLLPGVTPSRYVYLQQLNLTTLESLANANLSILEPIFGGEVAEQLLRQAQAKLENRVILISDNYLDLPTSSIELYFDIEAEPDLDLAYLLGVLVVDRQAKTETFHYFLAEKPEHEASIWHQFLELVWTYPEAPIFHFCDYEVQTVKRLARLYKTPNHLWQPLLTRFLDIHEIISSGLTLPLESYALKTIARWLGFEWRDAKVNGSQAIYWYDQWLKTGDRTFLDLTLRYNEDDCRATLHVKDWLTSIVPEDLINNELSITI